MFLALVPITKSLNKKLNRPRTPQLPDVLAVNLIIYSAFIQYLSRRVFKEREYIFIVPSSFRYVSYRILYINFYILYIRCVLYNCVIFSANLVVFFLKASELNAHQRNEQTQFDIIYFDRVYPRCFLSHFYTYIILYGSRLELDFSNLLINILVSKVFSEFLLFDYVPSYYKLLLQLFW